MDTKILLVQLQDTPDWEPLACETLAGAVVQFCSGCHTDICVVNPNLNNLDDFKRKIASTHYDIIGVSVPHGMRPALDSVFECMDSSDSCRNAMRIIGGHLPTALPETFLAKYPDIIIVAGWGEDALIKIVNNYKSDDLNLAEIPNIVFTDHGRIVATKVIANAAAGVPLRLPSDINLATIETSRGCYWSECTFCVRPPNLRKWRRLDIGSTMNQICGLKANGVTYFSFADEDFIGNDIGDAIAFANELKKIDGISFSMTTRVDNIKSPKDTEYQAMQRNLLLDTLIDAGLERVVVGCESLSNTQLKRYNKGIDIDAIKSSVRVLEEKKLKIELGFILFDPLLTTHELRENICNLTSTGFWKYSSVFLNEMRVHHGTKLKDMADKSGVLGEMDSNFASYKWKCKDPQVESVRQNCKIWLHQTKRLYQLVRNLGRTKRCEIFAEEYCNRLRKLSLDFLIAASSGNDASKDMRDRKSCFLNELQNEITRQKIPTSQTMELILAEIKMLGK